MSVTLSEREREILCAIADVGTIHKTAEALFISPHTVDRHLDNVRKKTGLRHLPQLVAWAVQNGLLTRVPSG